MTHGMCGSRPGLRIVLGMMFVTLLCGSSFSPDQRRVRRDFGTHRCSVRSRA